MAITKQKKAEIVDKVEGIIKDASTLVFAKFRGLTVAEQSEMRKALRKSDVGYTVAKKSLMRRALADKFEGTMPELEGEVAIAYAADEIAPARELAVFVKKFADHLAFQGGVFGGKFVNATEIKAIAAIPGMDTLRAMFAQVINSPRQRFAVVLSEVAKKGPVQEVAAAPAPVVEAPAEVEAPVEVPAETVEAPTEVVEAPAETPAETESSEQTS
jgi:large subunit ribosomal protein L10